MHAALPSMFKRLDDIGLKKSYVGLKGIRFVEQLEKGSNVMAYYDKSSDVLSIYPMAFRSQTRVDVPFYNGIGLRHWLLNVSHTQKAFWRNKLVYASQNTVDRLQAILSRSTVVSLKDIPKKFNTPIDRLIAIHVVNTLIANSLSASAVKNVSLREYPPTRDFCRGAKPYSLIPLLSVYRGGDGNVYEDVFAEFCSEKGSIKATELSVQTQLEELFSYVSGV